MKFFSCGDFRLLQNDRTSLILGCRVTLGCRFFENLPMGRTDFFSFKTQLSMKYVLINIQIITIFSSFDIKEHDRYCVGLIKHEHFQQKFALHPHHTGIGRVCVLKKGGGGSRGPKISLKWANVFAGWELS